MPVYAYKGVTEAGKNTRGRLDAESPKGAGQYFTPRELIKAVVELIKLVKFTSAFLVGVGDE